MLGRSVLSGFYAVSESHRALLFSEYNLPKQSLKKLTFCGHKPKQLEELLYSLPSTQAKHISVVLYKLLPEINQLMINGHQRLELMTILRPYVQNCIDGLAEDFLKQPLSLLDNMTKIAAIGQALQRYLCDGYLLAISQLLQSRKPDPKELSTLIYYATHGLGQLLYRSLQLYVPRPPQLWKKTNTLYQLAREFNLEKIAINDALLSNKKSMSTQQACFRILALGCSHTNQLRQVDIMYLYTALEGWAGHISLSPARDDDHSLYCIDLDSDKGPVYQSRYSGPPSNQLHAINLQTLIDHLNHPDTDKNNMGIPSHYQQALLSHLCHCWQEQRERQKSRIPTETELDICIGLKAGHQLLLQGQSFSDFLGESLPTESGYGIDGLAMKSINADSANYDHETQPSPISKVAATDESSDGFCLRWTHDVPPQIKSGEVILLRKPGHEEWLAGTIRWAQRLNHHTYVGVQLLAGHAEAAAASTTLNNGEISPFFRTMLLKNNHGTEDGHISLLTPTIPFGIKQNIQLQLHSGCDKAQLTQLLASSGSISQFSYRNIH